MTNPTPAVERAAEALVLSEGTLDWSVLSERLRETPRDQVRAILAAALTDPDDPDSLARTLYVLHMGAYGTSARHALRLWHTASDVPRVHWRAVADGFRMMLTGEGA